MKELLKASIYLAGSVSLFALFQLFGMFSQEVSLKNIVLSLSPLVFTLFVYLIYLKGSKDGEATREFIQELYLSWEAENNAEYYFVAGTLRKRTIYEDVEVFNESEWIQFSILIDVIDCFKK